VVWDLNQGKQLHLWKWPKGPDPHSHVESLSFAPDGTKLAAAVFRQGKAYIWDLSTGMQIARLDHQNVYGLSFSADGRTLATAGWDRIVRFWNTDTWTDPREINLADEAKAAAKDLRMYTVCYSPDGRSIATAHLDGTVKIWSSDLTFRSQFQLTDRFLFGAISFSPDGLWLVTGTMDGKVELWDPWTAKKVREVGSHESYVYTVGFGHDSRTIVSGGADSLCYVWDQPRTEGDVDLDQCWNDLAGDDSTAAYAAVCRLSEQGDRGVALVAEKLRVVQSLVHPENLRADEPAEEAERRIRMMKLLVKKDPKFQTALTLRRALAVLAAVATPEAIRQLEEISRRDPDREVSKLAARELKRARLKSND
jgi:hypothetical protein